MAKVGRHIDGLTRPDLVLLGTAKPETTNEESLPVHSDADCQRPLALGFLSEMLCDFGLGQCSHRDSASQSRKDGTCAREEGKDAITLDIDIACAEVVGDARHALDEVGVRVSGRVRIALRAELGGLLQVGKDAVTSSILPQTPLLVGPA